VEVHVLPADSKFTYQQMHPRIVRHGSVSFTKVVRLREEPDIIAYHLACIPKFRRENFSRAVQVEMKRLPIVPCESHSLTLPSPETDEHALRDHHCSIPLSFGTHRKLVQRIPFTLQTRKAASPGQGVREGLLMVVDRAERSMLRILQYITRARENQKRRFHTAH
jgi:hypothetical protein